MAKSKLEIELLGLINEKSASEIEKVERYCSLVRISRNLDKSISKDGTMISINRVMTAFVNTAVWGFYVSTNGGLYLQSKAALNTAGSTSANTIASFPIG